MAINGTIYGVSTYGDIVTFNWSVIKQEGYTSTISWEAVYTLGDNMNRAYIDRIFIDKIVSGITTRLDTIKWSDAKSYEVNLSTGSQSAIETGYVYKPSYAEQLRQSFKQYNEGWDVIYPTEIRKSGTFTINRSTTTNEAAFTIKIYGDGEFIYYDFTWDYNGTYYATFNSSMQGQGAASYLTKSATVSTTTTFGSPAQITNVSDFTDETSPIITYTYDRGSSVTSVKLEAAISFNGSAYDIPYREISSLAKTYTFNFTQEEKETLWRLLANGETATVRFYIKTTETVEGENNSVEHYLTKTFKFVNYTPIVTPTIYDTNATTIALTGNANHLIRYMSNVHYKMDVELRKGGLDVIGSYIQNGDRIQEGFLEGIFEAPTSNTFYFSVTDDRGITGTASYSLSPFFGEFINYIKLTSSLKCTPISTDGKCTVTITGKYFNANFGAAQNKLSIKYSVHLKDEEPIWTETQVITPTMTDNTTYSYSFDIEDLNYMSQYVIEVQMTDLLMSVLNTVHAMAQPLFYWSKDSFVFNVPVTFNAGFTNNNS